ncbi:MAG TPA: DUF4266 domain-containing protein [Cyclobacteriaceae bacterium]
MKVLFFIILLASMASCAPVKQYQKAHLNDEEMQLGERKVSVFEADFHSYREGAVGGTIGNSGSGCGCN